MKSEATSEAAAMASSPAAVSVERGLALRWNFAWTFTGNAVYMGCQWLILIILTKVTSPEVVGQFALALAVTAPIMILANQGVRDVLVTDAGGQFNLGDYLGYRILSTSLAWLFILGLAWVFAYPPVVFVVGLAKGVEAMGEVLQGYYQSLDRMDCAAISLSLRGLLSVVAVGLLLVTTNSLVWGAAGLVVAGAVVVIAYEIPTTLRLRRSQSAERRPWSWRSLSLIAPSLSWHSAALLTSLAFPLGVAKMLVSVTTNIPRYFLEHYSGAATLGVFAAIMYITVAGRTVVGALAQSSSAKLAREYAEGGVPAFRPLLLKLMLIASALGAVGVLVSLLFGAPLLRIVYSAEYAAYSDVLLLGMIIALVSYLIGFAEVGLTVVRAIRIQPIIRGSSAALACLLCFALVPRFDIQGGAWALLLTGLFQLVALLWALRRALSSRNSEYASPRTAA